jgi:dolichyl-phosphooligosaccharide-protein glycotransferase
VSEQLSRKNKLPPAAIAGIILLILCGISLYIRIALPYDQVFVDGSVWFRGTDAWYHMRLVDNLIEHFPHHISFDPYTFFPNGVTVPWPPFFDWLVAGVARLISLGSPTQHTIDVVGAYVPPILGTLTIIPVYFIGKELFNRWVGLLAAALVVVLPGEFLNRSLLGFTDHHAAESLFTTVTILFLILAVNRAREIRLSLAHLLHPHLTSPIKGESQSHPQQVSPLKGEKHKGNHRSFSPLSGEGCEGAKITRSLIYTLLAGIFLGIYLLTWVGGLMLLFIIFAWLVIQFIIDHLRGRSTDYLCIIGTLSFLIAGIIFLPFSHTTWLSNIQQASLAIAIITPMVLFGISRLMKSKAIKPIYYLPAILGLAGIVFAIFHAINPSLLHSMLRRFGTIMPNTTSTIVEAHPLLFPYGGFSWDMAWLNFATTFFISFISIGWLVYLSVRKESGDKTLFLVWSIVMLAAVLAKRRFSYYYAINAALLVGYFCWRILDFAGLRELLSKPGEAVKGYVTRAERRRREKAKARARTGQRISLQPGAALIKVIVAGVVIFFLVFFPCIGLPGIEPYTMVFGRPVDLFGHPLELRIKLTQPLASEPSLMNHAWYSSLLWLKDNTPEPFGDPDSYYELYEVPPQGEKYDYPESAYSVMSWWDYGHWITRIAHRIPLSNPFQAGAKTVARFFIAQDEESANEMLDMLGSKYVVIDYPMATSKFYAMPEWAGKNPDDFYGNYYLPQDGGKLQLVYFFYPSYYQSTVVRLYNFDGQAAVTKDSAIVISYEEKLSREGEPYREITSSKEFYSYEEAEAYVATQESGKYVLGNSDPFVTPVSLEEMEHYQLVYKSDQQQQGKSAVKIFEYTGSE